MSVWNPSAACSSVDCASSALRLASIIAMPPSQVLTNTARKTRAYIDALRLGESPPRFDARFLAQCRSWQQLPAIPPWQEVPLQWLACESERVKQLRIARNMQSFYSTCKVAVLTSHSAMDSRSATGSHGAMAGERKRMHRSQGEQPAVVETASETRMRFMEGAATLDAAASTSAAASMTKSMAEEEQEHNATVEWRISEFPAPAMPGQGTQGGVTHSAPLSRKQARPKDLENQAATPRWRTLMPRNA